VYKHDLCPKMEKATDLLGMRWNLLIVYQLLTGPKRFSFIESAIPISGRLLSERLKYLEKENIVIREIYPEVPVRVEYTLTEKGKALESIIAGIGIWSHAFE
jgi:DNA-binding HxlR family transcriptional regulator